MRYILILVIVSFDLSIAIAGDASLDSLIDEIIISLKKDYNIEQSGTGKVDVLEFSSAIFRKNPSLVKSEEYCFKSKKFGNAVNIGKYYKRIGFGVYDFENPEIIKVTMNSFLEGHEVNPVKFFKEGKHPALSPPFLILIKNTTLLFFYAKCEDIPKKKEWDKITDIYIKIFKKRLTDGEIIRCYCSGPVFIVK